MPHYTEKFKVAYDKVLAVLKNEGELAGKLCFRDLMLQLGPDERLRNLYRIQDKLTKKASFFCPNRSQERYLKIKRKRNIILKCRQVGFTTLNCLRSLDLALWEANTRAGIMCHKQEVVKTIFNDITKFAYDWFKNDWAHLYAPVENSDSSTILSFESDGLGRKLDSSILVLYDFRGKTVHRLHVSEAARIERDRLVGSLNGVPDNGEVDLESTAFGRDGEFYDWWMEYLGDSNSAPYYGIFVPWFEHYPEIPEDWSVPEGIEWTPYEKGLLESYPSKITQTHLVWRRWKIKNSCAGDAEIFENEYPTNPRDCFSSGEASVFSNSILKMHDKHVKEPIFTGFLMKSEKGFDLHDDAKGIVKIWESPDLKATYVMGADPSGGVGRDMSAAYVKNQKTGKIVAAIYGDLDPKLFGKELYKLGTFYNKAWICLEVNNHGHLVLDTLIELQYGSLYRRTTIDELSQKPTKKLGFLTTNETKLRITEKFKNAARDGKIIIPDAQLLKEMSTFIQTTGKLNGIIRRQASNGKRDDRVMAVSLTEEMDSNRPAIEEDLRSENHNNYSIDPETGFAVGVLDV